MSRRHQYGLHAVVFCLLFAAISVCPGLALAQGRFLEFRGIPEGNLVRYNGRTLVSPRLLSIEPESTAAIAIETPAPDGDDGDAIRTDPAVDQWEQSRRPKLRARINDEEFDQLVFGGQSAATAQQKLNERVRREVESLSRQYDLTASQKQKLLIAGQGDIKRFFDRVGKTRSRLTAGAVGDIDSIREFNRELVNESKATFLEFRSRVSGRGPLFVKVLNTTLTPEQIAAKREEAVVTSGGDLKIQ